MALALPEQTPKSGEADIASSADAKPTTKLRSCVMCRTRKVRCDKLSPCTNCRKGGVECVLPSLDRLPRWARRLERNAATVKVSGSETNPTQVMDRLKGLESLVKDLSGKLEKANAAVAAATAGSGSLGNSPGSSNGRDESSPGSAISDVQKHMGRLVVGKGESRYISSDFWARINDELDYLQIDTEALDDEDYVSSDGDGMPSAVPVTGELNRAPMERNGFLLGTNLISGHIIDTHSLHPLPSQIPFLLDVYNESFNSKSQIVHMPTLRKMLRDLPGGDLKHLTPANEALMFAIYYAAVTSMEEDNTVLNFGATKSELNMKYRVGLEHALAKADFLSKPDIILVQALLPFLFLVRRHDSPSYVWMMTGLAIRMGIALGLQRDGSQFPNLSPYDVEIRRRVWWGLVMLDMRSSEDQGTDFTIQTGSFDTQLPRNINDEDLFLGMTEIPKAKEGVTDTTSALSWCGMCQVTKEMMALNPRPTQEEQYLLLNKYYERLNEIYLQYENPDGNINYWLTLTVTRLVVSKMTLIIYLPMLFPSPNEQYDTFPADIQSRLFTSAIEVIEYNHSLNSETAYRPWRWIFQTCTHWHAIIYLLLSVVRRPWSAMSERAWVALHSTWLFPAQSTEQKDHGVWIPLKKLMTKARRYRATELNRLRSDPASAKTLALEEASMMQPRSEGPFPGEDNAEKFRQRWQQLLVVKSQSASSKLQDTVHQTTDNAVPTTLNIRDISWEPTLGPDTTQMTFLNTLSNVPLEWSDPQASGVDFSTWLWNDGNNANNSIDIMNTDFGLDMGGNMQDSQETSESAGEVDWNSWLATAKGMETQTI